MMTGSLLVLLALVALAAVWAGCRWASTQPDPLIDDLIGQRGTRTVYDTFDPELRKRADRRRRQADRVRRRAADIDVGVESRRRPRPQDTRQIRLISNE